MISSLLKHVVLLDCFARLLINKVYWQRPLVTKLPVTQLRWVRAEPKKKLCFFKPKGRVTSLQKSTKLIHSLTEAFPCKKLTKLVSKKPTGVCKN